MPFSFGGILLSLTNRNYNRKTLLSVVVAVAGLSQMATGFFNSFPLLCVMRALHGLCFSITIPLLATMVRDYFPKRQRGTANSLLYSANYFGTALSSLGIMIISMFGWRSTYMLMGASGLVAAFLANAFAKDRTFERLKATEAGADVDQNEIEPTEKEEEKATFFSKLKSSF